jgi:hypothetical protein
MRGGSRCDAQSRCNASGEATERLLIVLRSLPNTELLLTGYAPGCVSNRIGWVSIGLRLVVPVCFLAESPAGPVRLPGRSGSRIPIR